MIFFIIAIGLCMGSFITLASWRLPRGQDIVFGASRCPACERTLRARDLVPVFSWLAHRRKCRMCGARVHWRYPAIELATAGTFALIYLQYGLSLQAYVLMALAVLLLIMIVVDFEHYLIPDEIQVALLVLGVIYQVFVRVPATLRYDPSPLKINTAYSVSLGPLWESGYGFLLGAAIGLALCYGYKMVRKKEGLGFGDVKFLGVAGLWLGAHALVPFLFLSGLLGVATALLWKLLGRGKLFPFGPALAVSLFICVAFPAVPEAFWDVPRWIVQ